MTKTVFRTAEHKAQYRNHIRHVKRRPLAISKDLTFSPVWFADWLLSGAADSLVFLAKAHNLRLIGQSRWRVVGAQAEIQHSHPKYSFGDGTVFPWGCKPNSIMEKSKFLQ
jgi:hypothetical protein